MNEALINELRQSITKYLRKLREWLKPDPADTLGLTIGKSFYKGIVLLILIVFSPVLCLILTIAFLAAL